MTEIVECLVVGGGLLLMHQFLDYLTTEAISCIMGGMGGMMISFDKAKI